MDYDEYLELQSRLAMSHAITNLISKSIESLKHLRYFESEDYEILTSQLVVTHNYLQSLTRELKSEHDKHVTEHNA